MTTSRPFLALMALLLIVSLAHVGRTKVLNRARGPVGSRARGETVDEKLGIAGSGAIATGLAACATRTNGHVLWARSDASAQRATKAIAKACERLGEGYDPAGVTVTTDLAALGEATFIVEAVTEDTALKCELPARLAEVVAENAVLSTTTSSLSVGELAA